MFTITLIIGVLSVVVVRAYLGEVTGPEAERLHRAQTAAWRNAEAAEPVLPLWVHDDARTEGFTEALVAHLTRVGLSQPRIEAALTDLRFRAGVVSLAAHLEAEGADYATQCAAACDFALDLLSVPQAMTGAMTGAMPGGSPPASSPPNRAPAPARSAAVQPDANA